MINCTFQDIFAEKENRSYLHSHELNIQSVIFVSKNQKDPKFLVFKCSGSSTLVGSNLVANIPMSTA
jgi:hypothetical protein